MSLTLCQVLKFLTVARSIFIDIYTLYTMNDTQKMLQAIIHGQNSLKQELVSRIDKLDSKLGGRIDGLEERIDGVESRIDKVEKNLTGRLDRIGKQLAYQEVLTWYTRPTWLAGHLGLRSDCFSA